MTPKPLSIARYFGRLRDPRRRHLRRHLLLDIVAIAICGVIVGAKDWQQIATFARERHAWLQTFLALPNGIPSRDCIRRLLMALKPEAFQRCFQAWIRDAIPVDTGPLRHRRGFIPARPDVVNPSPEDGGDRLPTPRGE